MQSSAWAVLLRSIPAERVQTLSLVTTSGTEVALQGILRLEREFAAVRGRLAGSQDAGRVYFIPYTHIDYLGTQVEVKEVEFEAMFGHLDLSGAAPASDGPVPAVAPSSLPAPAAPAPVNDNTPLPGSGPSVVPIRSAVLERFRSRNFSATGVASRPSANGLNPAGSQLPG
jgi:hypothetical protein